MLSHQELTKTLMQKILTNTVSLFLLPELQSPDKKCYSEDERKITTEKCDFTVKSTVIPYEIQATFSFSDSFLNWSCDLWFTLNTMILWEFCYHNLLRAAPPVQVHWGARYIAVTLIESRYCTKFQSNIATTSRDSTVTTASNISGIFVLMFLFFLTPSIN